jgi:branched-chain amino acid transport system substrate-binding protein
MLAFLLLAACGGSASNGAAGVTQIKLGFPDDLTGSATAFSGTEQLRGAQLAVKDINASGARVHVELVPKDTQAQVPTAVAVMQGMLADASLTAIVGFTFTQLGQAVLPMVKDDGRPVLMMQVTSLPNRPTNVFSLAPSRSGPIQLMVEKVLVPRGIKTLSVIYLQQPTLQNDAKFLAESATKNGIQVLASESAANNATDFSIQITKVLASSPEAISVELNPDQAGIVVQQLRSRGYKGLLLGQQGMDSPAFRDVAGPAADGLVFFTFWTTSVANSEGQRLLKLYQDEHHQAPSYAVGVVQGWDAVHIMVKALQTGSLDKSKTIQALQSSSFNAAGQSQIKFSPEGFAQLSGYAVEMKGQSGTAKIA